MATRFTIAATAWIKTQNPIRRNASVMIALAFIAISPCTTVLNTCDWLRGLIYFAYIIIPDSTEAARDDGSDQHGRRRSDSWSMVAIGVKTDEWLGSRRHRQASASALP